jgi:hypothetical protein
MKTNNTDKKLELLLKRMVESAAADESTIDEVANSPALWRGVRRGVGELQSQPRNVSKIWRWLLIGTPAFAAVALLFGLFISRQPTSPTLITEQANFPASESPAALSQPTNTVLEPPSPTIAKVRIADRPVRSASPSRAKYSPGKKTPRPDPVITAAKDEIRSEFITLSYARDPESGQIVRVKVPRSMMVTVGLVASVEKPSSLVDAEVLVGDDGLTRAIRFIR